MLLVRVHGRPAGPWGRMVARMLQAHAVGPQVLDRVVVVVRVCWLCVVPQRWWVRWEGLVVVVGAPVVYVMVSCGVVRRVGWVACGGQLRLGVVVMEVVVVAVVLGHRGVGVGRGGGVVMVLVAPYSLALHEWRSLYGLDLCGQRPLAGVPG